MPHLIPLTRQPERAQNIPTDVKLTFLAEVFTAAAPLFENKDPSNPLPPDNTTGGTTT